MTTTNAIAEESRWRTSPEDPMPEWVCVIGGYEVLTDGNVDHATRWLLQFGEKGHPPIHGAGLSRDLHRLRAATHFGYLWWGNPRRWVVRWSDEWELMLAKEEIKRDLTGAMRIFDAR